MILTTREFMEIVALQPSQTLWVIIHLIKGVLPREVSLIWEGCNSFLIILNQHKII